MIFFFYGPNTFEMRQEIRRMEEGYRKKTGSDFGVERIDGAKTPIREIRNTLQAAPFLVTSRLMIVEDLGAQKPDAEAAGSLLEGVPDTTVVIFVDREADKRTAYFKTLSAKARAVEFAPVKGPQLLGWIEKEAGRQGGSIDRAAAQELVRLVGEDQWALAGEIAKLVAYEANVTKETVAILAVPRLSVTIFDLVDGMVAGRADEALRRYGELLELRTNEIYILTMVQWQLRNLLLAKTAGAMSQADLAKAAGMSPYVAGKAQAKARTLAEDALTEAFLASVECERRIKTGAEKADIAVERLILRVAGMVGGRKSADGRI